MSNPSPSRLSNYRDELTQSTVLGLAYIIHDHGYNTDRALPIQPFTVDYIQDDAVVFRKAGGHELHLPLHQVLTYLRFGRAPYLPEENTLSASL